MVVLALTNDQKYEYINARCFDKKESNATNNLEIKKNIERFLDRCVIITFEKFNTKVMNVIYDFTGSVDSLAVVTTEKNIVFKYRRSKGILNCVREIGKNTSFDEEFINNNLQKVIDYKTGVQELKNYFLKNSVSFGEAVECILCKINEGLFDLNKNTFDVIVKYFDEFWAGSNYCDGRFKFKILDCDKMKMYKSALEVRMYSFFDELPTKQLKDEFATYTNEKGRIKYLLEMKKILPPVEFWKKAQIDSQNLSAFAIKLSKIPGVPTPVNLDKIYKLLFETEGECTNISYNIDLLLKNY